MRISSAIPVWFGLGLAAAVVPASGQVLFSENFDVDPTANWTVNTVGSGNDANFFFDYSTVGIPAAPSSTGGTTIGLRLRANVPGSVNTAVPIGVSVSPIGQSFSGDYELRFDCWWNFNGPAPDGGNGSTQVTGAGIGTAGASAQVAGAVIDSIVVGATGDGGSSVDYRAYAPAAQSSYADASGVYAAGNVAGVRQASHAYYAPLGGVTPPDAQTALFSQQTGATAAGAPAFAWHDFVITKSGNTVTWSVDGLLLATVDLTTAGTLGGENILFTQFDINAGASTDPNATELEFGLIDNVRVTVVPEPSTVLLVLFGAAGLFLARRRG